MDNLNVDYIKENLDLGDIIFKNNNEIILLIERKTMDDLSASIRDGRYKEQKVRLLNTNINKNNIMYLIEGKFENKQKINGISCDSLLGSIVNTIFRDNILVFMTNNLSETIKFILKLKNIPNYKNKLINTKIENNDNISNDINICDNPDIPSNISCNNGSDTKNNGEKIIYEDYLKTKKDNMTPGVCFSIQLMQIPKLSNTIVKGVKSKYNNMYELCMDYNNYNEEIDKEKMLENIEISVANGKKTRKLGKVLSKRIYEYLIKNN